MKCDFLVGTASPSVSADNGPSNALNVLDLELMHNFCTSTYATLTHDPRLRDMWRVSAIQIALECDYVLRCVLAVSALQLARHRPEKRDYYVSEALLHHQIASRAAMAELSNVTRENMRRLHLFSILTIFFGWSQPGRPRPLALSYPPAISIRPHLTTSQRWEAHDGRMAFCSSARAASQIGCSS